MTPEQYNAERRRVLERKERVWRKKEDWIMEATPNE